MQVLTQISDYDQLTRALTGLAARCDGANSEDGMGFNKGDSYGGKYLAGRLSRGGELTPGEQTDSVKMLQKYRKQLASMGIDLPTPNAYQIRPMTMLGPQAAAPTPAKKTALPTQINYDDTIKRLIVTFEYTQERKNLISTLPLPQRKFERDPFPHWQVDTTLLDELIRRLPDAILTPAAQALPRTNSAPLPPPHQISDADMKINLVGGKLILSFPFDDTLRNKVKTLAEYAPDKSTNPWSWIVPSRLAMDVVSKFPQAQLDPSVSELIENMAALSGKANASTSDFDVPLLTGELMPFQKAAVEFIELSEGNCIIGDEMGLGKTIEIIGYLQLHPELRPAVVVCPSSIKINWAIEVSKFMIDAKQTHVIGGQKPYKLDNADIFLINYDLLQYWQKEISRLAPKVIIFDEAHRLKSGNKSKRGKAAIELCEQIEHRLFLTGTPILNRPAEFFPLLNMVDPQAWPNFFSYGRRYCNARQVSIGRGKMAWDFSGASNLQELYEKTRSFMIRRRKADVLKELPEKRRVIIPIQLSTDELAEYNRVLDEALEAMEEAGNMAIQLSIIEKAKQAAAAAKMPYVKEWIEDFLDTGDKLICFATHRAVTEGLYKDYQDKATCIIGGLSAEARQEAKEKFQTDPACQLISCNYDAAGEGITLTAASNLICVEYPWTPGQLLQAENRLHRIGQKNAATIFQFVALGTIEEDITRLLNKKATIIDRAIDGKATPDDQNIFAELIKILKAQ